MNKVALGIAGVVGLALAGVATHYAFKKDEVKQQVHPAISEKTAMSDEELKQYLAKNDRVVFHHLLSSLNEEKTIEDMLKATVVQEITLVSKTTGEKYTHTFNYPSTIHSITAQSFEHDVLQSYLPPEQRKPSLVLFYRSPPPKTPDQTDRHAALQFRLLCVDPRFNRLNLYACNTIPDEEEKLRQREGIEAVGIAFYAPYAVKNGELPKDASTVRKIDTMYGGGITEEDMTGTVPAAARWIESHLDNTAPSKVILLEQRTLKGGNIKVEPD